MIEIRVSSATDAAAIAQVRRESWRAAYAGIIAAPLIDRATATGGGAAYPPPYRRTLVAEERERPAVIGYASFGPERAVATASIPPSGAVNGQPRPAGNAAGPSTVPSSAADPCTAAASDVDLFTGVASTADPLTAAGRARHVGELYALYVAPAWWSAGVGRELMDRVLSALEADGYRRAVLWVLTENARARRFYERAGFAPDGATNVLAGLGGVQEVRYARPIAHRP